MASSIFKMFLARIFQNKNDGSFDNPNIEPATSHSVYCGAIAFALKDKTFRAQMNQKDYLQNFSLDIPSDSFAAAIVSLDLLEKLLYLDTLPTEATFEEAVEIYFGLKNYFYIHDTRAVVLTFLAFIFFIFFSIPSALAGAPPIWLFFLICFIYGCFYVFNHNSAPDPGRYAAVFQNKYGITYAHDRTFITTENLAAKIQLHIPSLLDELVEKD